MDKPSRVQECNTVIKKSVLALFSLLVLTTGWAHAQDSLNSLLEQGRGLLQKNEPTAALEAFEAAIKLDPNNAEALYYVGTIYLRLNQIEQGVLYLERSAQLAPDNTRLRFLLADTYGRLRMMDRAIEEYRAVVGMAPNSPEGREAEKRSRILQGKKYGEQGDYERALQIFKAVLSEYPDDVAVMLDVGLANLLLNRLDEARATLERVVLLQPNNGLAHSYLADVYDRKGDVNNSVIHYQRVVELLPEEAPPARVAFLKLTLIQGIRDLNNGQVAEATRAFEKVLTLDPTNRSARLNLTTAYRGLGDLVKSETLLNEMIKENPGDLDARLRLGALLYEEKRMDEAARELEYVSTKGRGAPQGRQAAEFLGTLYASEQGKEIQARIAEERIASYRAQVEKNPDNLEAWGELATLYLNLRRRAEALTALENVVRLQPNNGRALVTLGDLYDETSQYAKAIASYTKGVELASDEATKEIIRRQVVLVLAKKSFNEGHLDQAEAQFKSVVKKEPDNFMAHFFLGIIHTRAEKYEDALKDYEEVLRIMPNHLGARLNIAILYEQLGREEEALPLYRQVMRGGVPGMAETARARLKSLEQRIGGFSFAMSYAMSWDNNNNLSLENPVEELRSDLVGSVSYRRKLQGRPITWGISYNPTYSIYHNGQYDFMTNEISPSVSTRWRDYDISASYTYSDSTGLMNDTITNQSQSWYGDVGQRFKMRPLLWFLAADDQKQAAPSGWRVNGSYRMFESASAPLFDSTIYSLGGLLSQSLGNGWSWSGGYNFGNYGNTRAIGSDFAYFSNGVSFQLSKFLAPGWSANGGYSYTYSTYKNPDSVTRFQQRRVNSFNALSFGLNYYYTDMLRFFASYSYQQNSSNLPTGFILSPQDVNTAVGIQSPSLGDYEKHVVTVGMGINF